jgi:hypothetical protein
MKILKMAKSTSLLLKDSRLHASGAEFYASLPFACAGTGVLPSAQFFKAEEVYGGGAAAVAENGLLLRKGKGRAVVPFLDEVEPSIYSPPKAGEALVIRFETLKTLADLGSENSSRPEFCSVIGGAPGAAVIFANGGGGAMMPEPVLGEDPLLLPVSAARALLGLGAPEEMTRDGPYIWAEYEDGSRLRMSSFVLEEKMHSRIFKVLELPEDLKWSPLTAEWREAMQHIIKISPDRLVVGPTHLSSTAQDLAAKEEVDTAIEEEVVIDVGIMKKILPLIKDVAWEGDPRKIFWRGDKIHGVLARLVNS